MAIDSVKEPEWFGSLSGSRVVSGAPGAATAICFDSRSVVPGAVFVAVRGAAFDGHAFIGDAATRGAAYVVVQRGEPLPPATSPRGRGGGAEPAIVEVPDTRVALAEAAAGFYGHPARTLGTIGVTGTDGKTTTTHLIAHVLNATGRSSGYLSSVEFGLPRSAELNASHMTTLEAPEVQRRLASIRDSGGRYAVIEASSHGLDMHRVDQCEFDVGVFTNLTPDHLDYHGTMDLYRDAKAELFRMIDASSDKGVPKAAVLNADDPASEYMRSMTSARVMTCGLRHDAAGRPTGRLYDGSADLTASEITIGATRMTFEATYRGDTAKVRTGLLGDYNAANCLAAIAVAVSQGVPFADAAAVLESFAGVPGRMEIIDEGQPFRVIVDIASTEQAMRNVLGVLDRATEGRIIVVFGAAGERDVERRSGIARAVADLADYAVITNEDPRSENPDAIIDEIGDALLGSKWKPENIERIADRREALAWAFTMADPGDTVLLAGKGTEQSIVIGTTHHAWDERVVARELLRERFGV